MRNFENKQKIMRASGALSVLSGLMVAGYIIGAVVFVIIVPDWDNLPGQSHTETLKMLLYFALELAVWWNFWKFFRRLNNGHIFDAPTVGRLMTAGRWKLAEAIYLFTVWVMFSPHNLPGWGGQIDSVLGQLGSFWTPLLIIFVAWLLREGQNLEEEQELTV